MGGERRSATVADDRRQCAAVRGLKVGQGEGCRVQGVSILRICRRNAKSDLELDFGYDAL
jgi:hypothetical protein